MAPDAVRQWGSPEVGREWLPALVKLRRAAVLGAGNPGQLLARSGLGQGAWWWLITGRGSRGAVVVVGRVLLAGTGTEEGPGRRGKAVR